MKKPQIISILLAVLLAFPFLLNLAGWNLYLYVKIGDRDLIAAASRGSAHFAVAEPFEDTYGLDMGMDEPFVWYRHLVEMGPVEVFAEKPGSPLQPFTFRSFPPSDS